MFLWVLLFFFYILFVIKAIILSLFLAVIMLLGLRTQVMSNSSRFCPIKVVFHSALDPWW